MTNTTITVEYAEDRDELGVWCSTCQLPSSVRLHFVGLTADGVFSDLANRLVCTNCQSELFDEADCD